MQSFCQQHIVIDSSLIVQWEEKLTKDLNLKEYKYAKSGQA